MDDSFVIGIFIYGQVYKAIKWGVVIIMQCYFIT